MEAEITPSFIQAVKKYERHLEERYAKVVPRVMMCPKSGIFIKFKNQEPLEKQWNDVVETEYLKFKQKYPWYSIDKKTFRTALGYHPQGRKILDFLLPSTPLIQEYYDEVLRRIRVIEQDLKNPS